MPALCGIGSFLYYILFAVKPTLYIADFFDIIRSVTLYKDRVMDHTPFKSASFILLTLLLMLFGAASGYGVSLLLNAVAIPRMGDFFVTNEFYSMMLTPGAAGEVVKLMMQSPEVLPGVLLLLLLVIAYVWDRMLFGNYRDVYREHRAKAAANSIVTFLATVSLGLLFVTLLGYEFDTIDSNGNIHYESLLYIFITPSMLFLAVILGGEWFEVRQTNREYNKRSIILFTIAGVLLFATMHFAVYDTARNFFNALFALGGAGEPTSVGWEKITVILTVFGALTAGVLGSAILWMLRRKPFGNIAVPLTLTAVLLYTSFSFLGYTRDTLDMRFDTLEQALDIRESQDSSKPLRVLLLDANLTPKITPWPMRSEEIYGAGFSVQSVELDAANIPKFKAYMENGRYTYYTAAAASALIESTKRTWDIDLYREMLLYSALHKGSIIHSVSLLFSSAMMPVSETNKALLEKLSDESTFHITGHSAYELAKLWIAFGDIPKAEHFYGRIGENGSGKEYEPFEKLQRLYGTPDGVIGGRISGLSRSRIALVADKDAADNTLGPIHFNRIKDIKAVGEDGSFRFDGLVSGRYKLALLIPEDSGDIGRVDGVGMIILTKDRMQLTDLNITLTSR